MKPFVFCISLLRLVSPQSSESELLWAKWNQRLATVATFSVTLRSHVTAQGKDERAVKRMIARRPDKMRSTLLDGSTVGGEIVGDGTTTWAYDAKTRDYEEFPSGTGQFPERLPLPLQGFTPPTNPLLLFHVVPGKLLREAFEGAPALAIEMARSRPSSTRTWVYLSPKSKQPIGYRSVFPNPDGGTVINTTILSDLVLGPKVDDKAFVFEPPVGVEKVTEYAHLPEGSLCAQYPRKDPDG